MRLKSIPILVGFTCLMLILFPFNGAFAQKTIRLKIANFFPPPSMQSKILEQFAKDLEERSGGQFKVQYFAGGSLLKAPAIYNGIETGIADIGYSHVYYTPGRFPVTELLGLPLGVPSAYVGAHLAYDFYKKFKPKEWDRVKLLAIHDNAPSMVISKKPVHRLDDLKGLTIRAPGVPGEIIQALGGNPSPTPMIETYDAIAKGVDDGVWAPWETLRTFRFAEVAKYVTVCWQIGACFPFYLAMNKRKYDSLPEDLKEVVDTLSGQYQERYALMWNEIELVGKAFGLTKGIDAIELSPQEEIRWKNAVEPLINNYVNEYVKKGFKESEVREWIEYMYARTDFWTKKQVENKVPSPTGPPEMRPEAYVLQ